MTDDESFKAASAAADALLDLTFEASKETLANVGSAIADAPQTHVNLAQMEVCGSMAVDRLLGRFMQRIKPTIFEMENGGNHALQAACNVMVGGILAFIDDMPPTMQEAIAKNFVLTFTHARKHRLTQQAKRRAGH